MTDQRTTYRGRRVWRGGELQGLQAHWHGIPDDVLDAAREARNYRCVDCGDTPLGNGLRCFPCFTGRVAASKKGAA